jgi:hypothetical protein
MRHSAAVSAASVTTRASSAPAAAMTCRAVVASAASLSPASSTNSHPPPRGNAGTAAGPRLATTTSTIRRSRPSTAIGEYGNSAGTASAAPAMSA